MQSGLQVSDLNLRFSYRFYARCLPGTIKQNSQIGSNVLPQAHTRKRGVMPATFGLKSSLRNDLTRTRWRKTFPPTTSFVEDCQLGKVTCKFVITSSVPVGNWIRGRRADVQVTSVLGMATVIRLKAVGRPTMSANRIFASRCQSISRLNWQTEVIYCYTATIVARQIKDFQFKANVT